MKDTQEEGHLLKALLRQLFAAIGAEDVDADALQRNLPAVGQEKFLLVDGRHVGLQVHPAGAGLQLSAGAWFAWFQGGHCFRVQHLLVEPHQLGLHVRKKQLVDFVQLEDHTEVTLEFNSEIGEYHFSFENVIHNLVPRQTSGVDEDLEGELQPGVHLPSSRLSFAFFSSSLEMRKLRSSIRGFS